MTISLGENLTKDIVLAGRMMLWDYGNQKELNSSGHLREKISLHWLARSLRQLLAIDALTSIGFISDGWILFRSILERYLLYCHLYEHDEFDVFHDWCLKEKYNRRNKVKSNLLLKEKPEVKEHKLSQAEKDKYKEILHKPLVMQWQRPRMEDVAKRKKVKFLYDAGYDFASGFVHPVADDGGDDYLHLMGRSQEVVEINGDILLRDARLIAVLQIQKFMSQPEHNWRNVLNDLLNAFMKRIEGKNIEYTKTLSGVIHIHENMGLCESTTGKSEQ